MSIPMPEKRTVTNYVRDPNSEGDYGLVTLWENQALTPSGRHWGVSGDGGVVSPDISQSSMRLRLPQTFDRGGTSGAQLTRVAIYQTNSDEILVITGIGSKGSISTSPEIPSIYTDWNVATPPAKFPTSMVIRGTSIDFRVRMRWFIYDESDALIGSLTGPTVFVERNTEYIYKYDLDLSLLPDDIGKTARRTRATMWVYTSDGSPVPTGQAMTFYVGGLRIGVPHEIDFFDGNTEMDDPDFIVGWEGVELESKSIVHGEKSNFVLDFAPRSPFRSIKTSRMMDGEISSRVIYLGTVKTDWDDVDSISLFDAFFLIGDIMGDIPLSLSSTSMKVSFDKDMGVRTLNNEAMSVDLSPGDILGIFDGGVYSPTGRSIGDTHTIHALSNSNANYVVGPFEAGDSYYVRELTIIDGNLPSVMDIPPFYGDTEPFEYMGQIVYPQWDDGPGSTSSFTYYEPLSPVDVMPIDIWHSPGEKRYEIGVEKGMVYVDGVGQPWPGLVSVEKSMPAGEVESRYIDGVKYRVDIPPTDFSATIEAFTYPDMFEECLGSVEHDDIRSLRVNDQMARPFGMAYRTLIGDDILGPNRGYKLHLVYNAYALRSMSRHETLGDMMQVSNFTWDIHTVPVTLDGFRRTSYFTIDSTKENPVLMSAIESTLYGFGSNPPMMPTIQEIVNFLS